MAFHCGCGCGERSPVEVLSSAQVFDDAEQMQQARPLLTLPTGLLGPSHRCQRVLGSSGAASGSTINGAPLRLGPESST